MPSLQPEGEPDRQYARAQSNPKIEANPCIFLAKMDGPLAITGPQVVISQPDLPWVNETPAVLISHGRVFLTDSAGATGEHHCMGMLSADENADLLDPKSWTKFSVPLMASDAAHGV